MRRTPIRWLRRALAPAAALLAATLAACGDGPSPLAPTADAPRLAIRDAARGGGTPGFYFLSPIAPTLTTYPGTFDPARFTAVEVCAWSGTACEGPLVARFAGTDVQLNSVGQHYRVDWPTTGLAVGRLYRIRVLEGARELGFADAKIPGPGETPAGLTAQGIVPLGNGSRLAIRYRIETEAPNGAPVVTIAAPTDGLVLPAGAPVVLRGTALDAEDGDLSAQLVWRSDRAAEPLGTGAELTVPLAGGRHVLTAAATDARGGTGRASVQVVASIVTLPATVAVPYGGTASLPVTLTEPAPAGGLTLAVTSDAPGHVGVEGGTVTIPAGARSANATLRGTGPGTATITVAHPDWGRATTAARTTAQLDIVESSVSFAAGRTATLTVRLRSNGADAAAPAGGLAVQLSAAAPSCAAPAATALTIPAGLVSVTTTVAHGGGATPCSTTIAAASGIAEIDGDVVTVQVDEAPALALSRPSTRVGAGLRSAANALTLGAPAPAGGAVVTLTSADPARLRLSVGPDDVGAASVQLTVAPGTTGATWYAHALEGQTGTVAVTARATGYADGATTFDVVPAAITINGLTASTTSQAADEPFTVGVGAVDAAGTAIYVTQSVRPGASPLVVTVTNANAAVARLVTSAGAAQTRTVAIAPGASASPATVAAGGIAFDVLAGGTTTVAASAPGVVATSGATRAVAVTGAALSVYDGIRVGAGLRTSTFSISIPSMAPAGGVTVTLTSADPSRILVSGAGDEVGAESVQLSIAPNATAAIFRVHGVGGTPGPVTLTATAPGFAPGTATATLTPAAVDLSGVVATTTTLSGDDDFVVRVGALDAAGTGLWTTQEVRPGAAPFEVAVVATGAARVVTRSCEGSACNVAIAPKSSSSPGSVADGGIALRPTGVGAATVSIAPGAYTRLAAATQNVTITGPALRFSSGATAVGAGLAWGTFVAYVQLDAPAPAGGLPVTITSGDPARLLVSPNSTTDVGTASTTITVPQGTTIAYWRAHGVEGQTGAVTVTATAPAFATARTTVTVTRPAIEIVSAPGTLTTFDADRVFNVRVGTLAADGTTFTEIQAVRPGGTPIVATVASSAPAVAQLVTSAGAAATRTVTITPGTSSSATTVAGGGVAIRPVGTGTTSLTVSAPDVVTAATGTRALSVTLPSLFFYANPRVGAGLYEARTVGLSTPAPAGGARVTITSSNPGVLLLSATSTGAAAASITVTMAAGTATATYWVHGLENVQGTVALTATTPGATDGTSAVTVAPYAVDFSSLSLNPSLRGGDVPIAVRAGVVSASGTAIDAYQSVRPGAPAPLTVTVGSSLPSVLQFVTADGAGGERTVSIAPGQLTSATGALKLRPLAVGASVVTATAPDAGLSRSYTVTVGP